MLGTWTVIIVEREAWELLNAETAEGFVAAGVVGHCDNGNDESLGLILDCSRIRYDLLVKTTRLGGTCEERLDGSPKRESQKTKKMKVI